MKTVSRSYVANSAIASVVLAYALRLSVGDRGPVDWAVISIAGSAVLWNLVRAGLRLRLLGGGKAQWHLGRTVLFWIIGLFNTAFLLPEQADSFRPWVGWLLVAVATFDTIALIAKEARLVVAREQGTGAESAATEQN
ncbi:hypothetical protein [Engelhardtia mirabilis]|uniref:Uncharacterized protein n=1 Tax=Engelhardtia mirabilis TaxID=2528011 RepID=A0A518BFH7_9BACT|nr:hypothetical protein Pla133_07280 [Planctomycetes bacterium Pla133]QDU99988.1 hypothetical protein Pla86_07270 [Planctomycetes bacterium Pla86]